MLCIVGGDTHPSTRVESAQHCLAAHPALTEVSRDIITGFSEFREESLQNMAYGSSSPRLGTMSILHPAPSMGYCNI